MRDWFWGWFFSVMVYSSILAVCLFFNMEGKESISMILTLFIGLAIRFFEEEKRQ